MLRFLDSFDHLTVTGIPPPVDGNVLQKWTSKGSTGVSIVANGRNGQGLFIASGSAINKTIDQQDTWIIGFAVNYQDQGAQPGPNQLVLGNINTALFLLQHNADSTFSFYAGGSVNPVRLIATTSFSTRPNIWYYFECKVTFSGTDDIQVTASLRIDGSVKGSGTALSGINVTSLITQTATANFISIGSSGSSGIIIDDVYMFDGTGTKNKDFAGDIKIGVIFPISDVATPQWTPIGASGGHFNCVKDNPPDGDTSYIKDNVVGHLDNFNWQQILAFTGSFTGVQYSMYARKDDEGTRSVKLTVQGGVQLSPAFFVNDTYNYYSFQIEQNPTGPKDWTVADFNASTFGVKLDS